MKILFIEDEENLLNSMSLILGNEGYTVTGVTSGEAGLEHFANEAFDLALIDINLPGINGLSVAEKFREVKPDQRVMMLTGHDVEDDIVFALENYANDYVLKPVRPRILIARINNILKHVPDNDMTISDVGVFIGNNSFEVYVDGSSIDLTKSEFLILKYLMESVNTAFSRTQLIAKVKGEGYIVTDRTIDFQICCLRKKLGHYGANIQTVRGIGYKYKA